jgi:hypothetical protein
LVRALVEPEFRWEGEEAMFGTPVGLAGGSPKRLAMERHDAVFLF